MPELVESADTYRSFVRTAIRGLWAGIGDESWFMSQMVAAIRREFTFTWERGSAVCGIKRDEWSDAERAALDDAINQEVEYAANLAAAVKANSKASGGALGSLMSRVDLWVNRINDLENRAKIMACGDTKLAWRIGATLKHCEFCLRLDGKVKRASQWLASGWYPGFHLGCGCGLEVTDAPMSKGTLPRMA